RQQPGLGQRGAIVCHDAFRRLTLIDDNLTNLETAGNEGRPTRTAAWGANSRAGAWGAVLRIPFLGLATVRSPRTVTNTQLQRRDGVYAEHQIEVRHGNCRLSAVVNSQARLHLTCQRYLPYAPC